MSSPPRQPTVEGERLRRSLEDTRRRADGPPGEASRPVGSICLFAVNAEPGNGWHRANGGTLLRSKYPRLASVLPNTGDDAVITLPSVPVPVAGTFWWIWGPE
jgi:hypothetical protein